MGAIQKVSKKNQIDRSHYLFDNKALRALIIPLIIEQLLALLVGMADSIMVASVGEAAVSAVSLVDTVFILMINIFSALATGGAVIAGQYLGKKRPKEACKAVDQLTIFIVLAGVVITALIYVFRNPILHSVFGHIEPDVMSNAKIYLMITNPSIPFIALYNAGAAVFRAMGNSKISMKMSIVMNTINLAGNAILIYGFHFGVDGVAIPTLISRVFAGVGMLVLLRNQKRVLHFSSPFSFRLQGWMLKKILHLGIPNGLENSMFQLGKILVLSMVSAYGTASITANAICNNLCSLQILPGMSIGFAILAVTAQCVGAGDYEQIRYYTKKLVKITYAAMLASVLLIWLCLPLILKLYGVSDLANEYATKILWWHGAVALLIWPLSFSLPNALRAANDVTFCMVLSVASMWIVRIAGSYLLGTVLGLDVFGVWVAMTIDWMVRSVGFVWRYWRGRWRRMAAF